MSPAPAVTQPHANRLSVSHPVDMHAQAIIIAPMTNTKSEPIANLRIQGIVSSNSRSGLAALITRVRRPTSANQVNNLSHGGAASVVNSRNCIIKLKNVRIATASDGLERLIGRATMPCDPRVIHLRSSRIRALEMLRVRRK